MKQNLILISLLLWGCVEKSTGRTSSVKNQKHESEKHEPENIKEAKGKEVDSCAKNDSKMLRVPIEKEKKQEKTIIEKEKNDSEVAARVKSTPIKKIAIVQGDPIQFKKIKVKIKTRINAFDVSSDCKNIAVGGKMMDLSLITKNGKNKWQINHIRNTCQGKRCTEGVVPFFLTDNKKIIAALNGDTLRKFNIQGKALAFRGGYPGRIKKFSLFNSKKYVAAQYRHGLAVWRTTIGLVGKIKIPFRDRLFFGKEDKFLQKTCNYLILKTIKNKVKRKIKEKRKIIDVKGTNKEWIILYPQKLEFFSLNLSRKKSIELPSGYKPVKVSGRINGNKVRIIARKDNNWFLLLVEGKKFRSFLLKNLPKTEDLYIYLSSSLVAFGKKKTIWIHELK
ncbi:MAG: hypothetical protein PF689_05345 [Deltaproteobacteria bacterium]|jgi:hypothetical protein|nr:hypothetical protein [Deltaproteobacteria bacterium]